MTDLSKYANKVYKIIGAAMSVHSELGYGLLEPVYQEAMHLELLDRGIANEREQEIEIYYKKGSVGHTTKPPTSATLLTATWSLSTTTNTFSTTTKSTMRKKKINGKLYVQLTAINVY